MADEHIFWTRHDPPTGAVVFWRGNGGVDWEVRYVPEAAQRALADIRGVLAQPVGDPNDLVEWTGQLDQIEAIVDEALE